MKLSLKKKSLKTLQQPLADKQLGQAATPQVAGGVTTSRGWCVTTGLCTDSQLC